MKKRLISAVIALLIIVPIIILGGEPYKFAVIILALLGMKELLSIIGTKKKVPLGMQLFSYLVLGGFLLTSSNTDGFVFTIDYRLISAALILFLTPLILYHDNRKYNIKDALYLVGIVLFLSISFKLLILLRAYYIKYLVYLFLLKTITDTYALLTGMLIGKHKMTFSASPNKTLEGCIGGAIVGTLFGVVFFTEVINSDISLYLIILITFFLSTIGQAGDLIFSSIKRYYDRKDFSNIMPGHGGILDRLDSIIFVLLAFSLFASII